MTFFSFSAYLYRRHLASFLFFRLSKELVMIVYRGAYRVRSRFSNSSCTGKYQMTALSQCTGDIISKKYTLENGAPLEIPAPYFIGYHAETATSRNPVIHVNEPTLEIFEFPEATLVGGVDFIFKKDKAIHHDLFKPSEHHCPAENNGVISINRRKNTLGLYLKKQPRVIESAINLIGQCSGNYAHWLTETLPKLALLDSSGEYPDLPLIVDDGLHANIYASLALINKGRREVIKISRWEPISLTRCITLSHPGYERYAPHSLSSKEPPAYINTFSRMALRSLRDATMTALETPPTAGEHNIYLARGKKSGNIRQIENLDAIETVIASHDVHFITPETMSFAEQAASCMNATMIVAPIGASLANMIFAPPGCNIIALSPFYDEAHYYYYSNLSGVLGHKIHYVLGPQTNAKQHPIHRNYSIDPEMLSAAIKKVRSLDTAVEPLT